MTDAVRRGAGAPVEGVLPMLTILERTASPPEASGHVPDEPVEVALARFRSLVENSSDFVSRHAPDGTYRYASPAVTALLGYDPAEMIGRSAYEFFHPDDLAQIVASHEAVAGGADITVARYRIRREDGGWTWFETTANRLRDESGETIEIHCASRDISDVVEWARHRDELLSALEDANEALEQVTTAAAHDLRSPLHRVGLGIALLRRVLPDAPAVVGETLDRMSSAVDGANEIIAQTMDTARRGIHRSEDVSSAVAGAAAWAGETTGIGVEVDVPPGLRAGVPRAQLRRVVQNLLTNADRHAVARVRLVARPDGDRVELRVEDDGPGFPDDPERLLRAGETGDGGNTGFGLTAVHDIVRDAGGALSIDTSPELGGARVSVVLPAG